MMKCDDLYFASPYNSFTDCVEWYILPKTEIKVFFEKNGYTWFLLVTIDIYMYIYIYTYIFKFVLFRKKTILFEKFWGKG